MESKDWGQQIAFLRTLTGAAECLHEAQMLQLKHWGAVAFHHLGSGKWDAAVDLHNKVVDYRIERAKHPRNFAHLIAALDRSVHWLLGGDWVLRVTESGKPLYEGERLVTSNESVNEQRQARVKGRGHREGGI